MKGDTRSLDYCSYNPYRPLRRDLGFPFVFHVLFNLGFGAGVDFNIPIQRLSSLVTGTCKGSSHLGVLALRGFGNLNPYP